MVSRNRKIQRNADGDTFERNTIATPAELQQARDIMNETGDRGAGGAPLVQLGQGSYARDYQPARDPKIESTWLYLRLQWLIWKKQRAEVRKDRRFNREIANLRSIPIAKAHAMAIVAGGFCGLVGFIAGVVLAVLA